MLIINFTKRGEPIADDRCEELIRDSLNAPQSCVTRVIVSTYNIIQVARMLLAEGVITPSNIGIFIYGQKLQIDDHGKFVNTEILPDLNTQWAKRTALAQHKKCKGGRYSE